MKTISISNQKGGVGKTTTVVNLAGALAQRKKSVLIIDLDPQGNSGQILNHNSPTSSKNIFTDIPCKPTKTNIPNIDIIPADRTLSDITHLLSTDIDRQFKIKDYIHTLKESKKNYDYILLDTPPTLGGFSTASLLAADYVLIPISTNFLTIKGSDDLIESIQKIKKRLNPALELLGVCITMHDKRTVLSLEVLKQIRQNFKEKCFNTIISKTIQIEESQVKKSPVVQSQPNSTIAKKFLLLAEEIEQRIYNENEISHNKFLSRS